MRTPTRWLSAMLLAVLLIQEPAVAGDSPATEPRSEQAAAATSLLSRVGIIGASATCGFGVEIDIDGPYGRSTAPVDFAKVLQAMLPADSQLSHHGSLFFFNAPMAVGPDLASQALRHEPTIVVGIDYLFWFGYGHRDAAGKPIANESARLELLEEGLKQLERFECPVLVGDFPNMAAAVGKMLGAAQLPEPATLEQLNKRVREWAKDRPNVTVVPLSQLVGSMQAGVEVRIGEQVWTEDDVAGVIQDDQLHPTVDGMVLMAQQVMTALIENHPELEAEDFVLDREKVVKRLRDNIEQHAAELARKLEEKRAAEPEPAQAP